MKASSFAHLAHPGGDPVRATALDLDVLDDFAPMEIPIILSATGPP